MNLLYYELKNSIKNMAVYVCTMMAVFIVTILVIAGRYAAAAGSSDASDTRMIFGVAALGQEQNYINELVDFASGISSLNYFCRLEIFEEDEGFKYLKNGDIQMLMVIPEGFMDAAEHMEEAHVIIYVPEEMSAAQYKALALFGEIEGIMSDTEGAIKCMYDGMEKYTFNVDRSQMEDDIFGMFVNAFLERDDHFTFKYISPYGDYPVAVYLLTGMLLFLVMTSGAVQFGIYGDRERQIEKMFAKSVVGKTFMSAGKLVCTSFPMLLELWAGVLLLKAADTMTGVLNITVTPGTFAVMIPVSLSMGAVIQLTASFVSGRNERISLYIIFSLLMTLASGLVVSRYYLPEICRETAGMWPAALWRNALLGKMLDMRNYGADTLFTVYSILLIAAAIVVYEMSGKKNR